MSRKKEIKVFCDFETNKALVRIFKFKNGSWSGGKVYEVDRESSILENLANIITKYRDVKMESMVLTIFSDIFWNGKTEKAVTYHVDMGSKHEMRIL